MLCEPDIANNILIDDYNNIHLVREISILDELIHLMKTNTNLRIELANKVFEIPIEELFIKNEQIYVIKNAGLNIVDEFDIHNFERGNIIVKVKLV